MLFTGERQRTPTVIEREFTLDGIPGILWTPALASGTSPVPLILMGQPGGVGLSRMRPSLTARALQAAAQGFATMALELPGAGERAAIPDAARVRGDLRAVLAAGERPDDDLIDRLVLPLVDRAVPEWQRAIVHALELPELDGRLGYSGGVIAVGVRLVAVEPRIRAAGLFAGSYVPRRTMAEARSIAIPLHVLLQWDDVGNDRRMALDLFDAFGSTEKTLSANMGGHTGVPAFAGEEASRFFARHLGRATR